MNKIFSKESIIFFSSDSYLSFRKFKWIFDILFEVLLNFWNPMA